MADGTRIEWATATWNPITGCTPISEGCANCYARRMANRLAGRFGYPADDPFCPGTYHQERLREPERWKKPRRIFVGSMGDMFHDESVISPHNLGWVFGEMYAVPHHTYLLLTKRPDNMKLIVDTIFRGRGVDGIPCNTGHIWLGVTAENQARADERIPKLLEIPAAVRFVSVEPMLGPVDLGSYFGHGLDWVICGGETGSGARPMDIAWARDLRAQCDAAGVPFFFKRVGGGRADENAPPYLRVRQWPKEAGDG